MIKCTLTYPKFSQERINGLYFLAEHATRLMQLINDTNNPNYIAWEKEYNSCMRRIYRMEKWNASNRTVEC